MRSNFTALITILVFTAVMTVTTAPQKKDPITGTWDVTFSIQGKTASGTFTFKLDGQAVTGTVDTAHTGPGTLSKGVWAADRLSFTLNFAKHESIDVTGGVKEDRLEGSFATEGTTGTWVATRHKATSE